MFVADTNVISMSDPSKRAGRSRADLDASEMYLTTVTIAEIGAGIARLDRMGAVRKAAELEMWWAGVERAYAERILPFDVAAARVAGRLADLAAAAGHDPGWQDIQIAAIAAAHGFTVLTRNGRHFAPLGVPHVDPYAGG